MRLIFSLLVYIFPLFSWAQNSGYLDYFANHRKSCYFRRPYIVFGNGMFTSFKNATAASIEIENYHKGVRVDYFGIGYNHNEFFSKQILEAIDHWKVSVEKNFLRWMRGQFDNEKLAKTLIPAATEYIKRIQNNDTDLIRMVDAYKHYIDRGFGFIVVAHSQGNFYANMAYDKMIEPGDPDFEQIPKRTIDENFRVIGVGNPDSRVANGGQYVTFRNDFVIKLVPYSLPGNNLRDPDSSKTFNHFFIDDYYDQMQTKDLIDSYLNSEVRWAKRWETSYSYDEVILEAEQRGCKKHFQGLEAAKNAEECSIRCASKPSDMSTFTCNTMCDTYCCGIFERLRNHQKY